MPSTITPATVGDALHALSREVPHGAAAWRSRLFTALPDEILFKHQTGMCEHNESGSSYYTFLAPSTAALKALGYPETPLTIEAYTLRNNAEAIVSRGMGVMIFIESEDADIANTPHLTLTCGQIVQFLAEGTFHLSPTVNNWHPAEVFSDDPDQPVTTFFLDRANPETPLKIEVCPPPVEVIPTALHTYLQQFLTAQMPGVEMPLLAWNPHGKHALIFRYAGAQIPQGIIDSQHLLRFLLPDHYHVILLPTPTPTA